MLLSMEIYLHVLKGLDFGVLSVEQLFYFCYKGKTVLFFNL